MFPAFLNVIQEVEQEDELRRRHAESRTAMRVLRDSSDPFTLPNTRFKELFRLNKEAVLYLFNLLVPHLVEPQRSSGVTPVQKILCTLIFYASGSYQRVAGQGYLIALSQPVVSRAINEVSRCIYNTIAENWIKFPTTEAEKQVLKAQFMEATGFPGAIGAIDATHIKIMKPTEEEHNYLNRKGFHSKNVQIICDYNLKVLAINARYASATHDSFIWRNSSINREMEEWYNNGDESSWLLGDSGYPLQPWLMTPIQDALADSPEGRYNRSHCSTRNCVERCIGVLKCRFRCILGERTLRYNPSDVGVIVTACAVLHNVCLAGDMLNDEWENFQDDIIPQQGNANNNNNNLAGQRTRRGIVQNYFN